MVKYKTAKSLAWKPISMKSRVLSQNLDLEGLIGVEELTDYSLDKVKDTVIISAPKSKSNINELSSPSNETKKKMSQSKRKKLKKKLQNKINLQKEQNDNDEDEDIEDDVENDYDDFNEIEMNVNSKVENESISKKLKRKLKRKEKRKNQNKFIITKSNENADDDSDDDNSNNKKIKLDTDQTDNEINPKQKKKKKRNNNKYAHLHKDNLNENNETNKAIVKQREENSNIGKEKNSKNITNKESNKIKVEISENDSETNVKSINEILVEMSEWTKFNIHETIIKALYEKGFKTPTKIQSLVLPAAMLARKNIVGAAETGSGKTLAFGIPILNGIINSIENGEDEEDNDEEIEEFQNEVEGTYERDDEDLDESNEEGYESKIRVIEENENARVTEFIKHKRNKLYSLILAPTRELAMQVHNHIKEIGKHTKVQIACIVGGMSTEKQLRMLNKCPHILVGTPGRLWEFIQLGHFHLINLNQLKYLVIDETDRMIESGHFPELKNMLDRIITNEKANSNRQTFVFSATLTHQMKNTFSKKNNGKNNKSEPSLKKLQDLLKISKPKIIDITESIGLTKTLTECKILCKFNEKDNYLYYFISKHRGRTLIFLNSISSVKRLTNLFILLKCSPLPLHASMNQRQRLNNLDKFRDNPNSILLATDVAARGLDIPNIEHVIHYHVPRSSEIYIHRSGRTARANNEGLTLLLMEQEEVEAYIKIFNNLNKKLNLLDFPIDETYAMLNHKVQLAKDIQYLESKLKKNSPDNWIEKAAQDMDIILDEDVHYVEKKKHVDRETIQINKLIQMKKKQLNKHIEINRNCNNIQVDINSALNMIKCVKENEKQENKTNKNKKRRKFKKKNKKNVGAEIKKD